MMRGFIAVSILCASGGAWARSPDCTGPDRWPAVMAAQHLGMPDDVRAHIAKTMVTRLSSEKVAKDRYLQVHLIRYTRKSGEEIQVLTVSDASSGECSGDKFEAYAVSREITLPTRERSSTNQNHACPDPPPDETARQGLIAVGVMEADQFDPTKSIVTRVTSEKLRPTLTRQVNMVTLAKKSDEAIRVLTVDELSKDGCPVGPGALYILK